MNDTPLVRAATGVVRQLRAAGHQAFFAGGCVRDLVMRVPPADVDIATSATPDEVAALFPGALSVGAQFGVVIVRVKCSADEESASSDADAGKGPHLRMRTPHHHEFEVATFRTDHGYEDGRHPTAVSFTDAEGDVRRRDFTINGMLFDPLRQEVLDLVGGREDIARRVVRAIGDPEARFAEDRLRMLRAVRFASRLDFAIDPATAAAIRAAAPHVTDVSWERIAQELEAQLVPATRTVALRLMDDLGLLEPILPEVTALKGVVQGKRFHPEGDAFDHTLMVMEHLRGPAGGVAHPPSDASSPPRAAAPQTGPVPAAVTGGPVSWPLALGALLHDVGKAPTLSEADGRVTFYEHDAVGEEMARGVCHRLRQSRRTTETVAWLVRRHMAFLHVREMRPATLKRLMRHEDFPLLLEVFRADALASSGDPGVYEALVRSYTDFLNEPVPAEPLITGHDLIAMGLAPGPELGRILEAVEDARLEGRVTSREEALALARELAGLPGEPP